MTRSTIEGVLGVVLLVGLVVGGASVAIDVRDMPPPVIRAGLPLIGTGSALPNGVWSPAVLSFGQVPVGDAADLVATLTNRGGGRLVGRIYLPTDCRGYQIMSGSGDYNLGAGQSRQVVVRFQPPDTLEYRCTLQDR